jgi:hypothetical protein
VLGLSLTPDQVEGIRLIAENDRVSIKSGHGVGKTNLMAAAVLWFKYSFQPSVVLTTAPTERQVRHLLWREIRGLHGKSRQRLECTKLNTMQLELDPKSYALGFSTNEATQIQGFHSPHILVIIDEANGYPEELYTSIEGLLSGGERKIFVQIGNPVVPAGTFFNSFSDIDTKTLTISCLNHPNVLTGKNIIPGAVTLEWVEKQARTWGKDSSFWDSRVIGVFPKISTDLVINLAWVEHAEQVTPCKGERGRSIYMGYDVAEYGDDEHVWYIGTRRRKIAIVSRKKIEPIEGVGITLQLQRQYEIPGENITIDGVGAGALMYSAIREKSPQIRRFVAGEVAMDTNTFEDKSIEGWWNLRNMLNPESESYEGYSFDGRVDKLKADLCTRKYITTTKGKVMLETKKEYRKRLKRSPNFADAMMLCYSPMCTNAYYGLLVLPNVY